MGETQYTSIQRGIRVCQLQVVLLEPTFNLYKNY
jgi:hypothetical protein